MSFLKTFWIIIILIIIISIPNQCRNYRKTSEVTDVQILEEKCMVVSNIITFEEYKFQIGRIESRNNYHIISNDGYLGRYQFSATTLRILKINPSKFITHPEKQDLAMQKITYKHYKILKNMGYLNLIGREVNGTKITLPGLLACAHACGIGKFVAYLDKIPNSKTNIYIPAWDRMKLFEGYIEDERFRPSLKPVN